MARHINFEEIENFRELGGYETPFGETAYGVIYRSGHLCNATENDLKKIEGLGIKSVIDFRTAKTKSEYPDRTNEIKGIKHYQIEVNGGGRIALDFEDMVESYMEMFANPANSKEILETIAYCEKPCVIHCTAGKDRTGAYVMLLLWANGVSFNDICADYMLTFPLVPKLYASAFNGNEPKYPLCVLEPNMRFMPKVLEVFKQRFESPIHFFKTIGCNDQTIDVLCNILHKQEKSCGAVVFHKGKVLIEKMAGGHFSIPKGHVESEDANEKATALREIKEETSLDVTIRSDDSYFIYYSPFKGCVKKVVFFVANANETHAVAQESEVSQILWLSPEDALKKLTYQSDKDVLLWALSR